ncbi:MAG TPA: response regulator transcription factor [Gammaproteobacteria bacterium]|nr:response regulator transcription factor [Gammaproteobacteria bacterium]
MNILQTLIVDDEPLNREELRYLLNSYERIDVVAEAETVDEACIALQQYSIDLVLLDIEMEEATSGFTLAEKIALQDQRPYLIFVTAHAEYSLQSFDYAPLHYLTKPINEQQLAQALARAFKCIHPSRIAIKYCKEEAGETIHPIAYVDVKRIVYIQKEKLANTLAVYLDNGQVLTGVRQTLRQFQSMLNSPKFESSHTSFIVNLTFVEELKPRKPGDDCYCLQLKGISGSVPVSQSRLALIRHLLERM